MRLLIFCFFIFPMCYYLICLLDSFPEQIEAFLFSFPSFCFSSPKSCVGQVMQVPGYVRQVHILFSPGQDCHGRLKDDVVSLYH